MINSQEQQHERLLGRTLRDGEYQVVRVLGHGGTGTVFLAVHTSLALPFALKQMCADSPLPEIVITELDALLQGKHVVRQSGTDGAMEWNIPGSGGEQTDHFIREALFLARLHHPAIPALYDYFFQDGYWYLVMDYIAGPTLHAYLRERAPLPTLEALGYAIQLCEVLDYLHKQAPPLLFRDLKPSNALLGPDGALMLIDFGCACSSTESTRAGTLALGSPGYIAPEQLRADEPLDARADLYSLGVILYEMLCGRRPQQDEDYEALHRVNPNVSHVLSGLVDLATRPDPCERFQSAHTCYLALERAYGIEERRTYQQYVISATDPQLPVVPRSTPVELDQATMMLSTREAFAQTAPVGTSELERRSALRETLRQERQRRLAQEQLEIQLASVDESLERRALSLSQISLQAVAQSEGSRRHGRQKSARTTKPLSEQSGAASRRVRVLQRFIQVAIFLLLVCFVVLTSLLVYLRDEQRAAWQKPRPVHTGRLLDAGLSPTAAVTATALESSPTATLPTSPGAPSPMRTGQHAWHVLPELPLPAADNASVYVEVAGRAYVYMNGGYLGARMAGRKAERYDHHLYRYDIAARHWEVASTNFPALVNNAATADERGDIFFTAGYSPDKKDVVSALYRYAPQDSSLRKIVPPQPIQIGFGSTLLADRHGHLYLTQGFLREGDPQAQAGTGWYRYDLLSGKWQVLAPLPRGLGYVALALKDEQSIFLFGGSADAGQAAPSSTMYRYDAVADSWTRLATTMPRPFSGMAGCQVWPGQFVLAGGYDLVEHTGLKGTWLFDMQTARWQELAALPSGGSLLGSAACDGRGQLFFTRGADDPAVPTRDFWLLGLPRMGKE